MSGSFGARADNDLLAMAREFGARIHFVHLRQVTREPDGSFHEAEHFAGSSDMVGVIRAMMEEEAHRRRAGRPDHEIPMRPDHGHLLADDIGKKVNPGLLVGGQIERARRTAWRHAGLEVCKSGIGPEVNTGLRPAIL